MVFPIFNGMVCAILGALIGYYAGQIVAGILFGGMVGLLVALPFEWAMGKFGLDHWLYQRRVLLLVLLEIPLAAFVCGPYAYVLVETRPNPHPIDCGTPYEFGAQSYEDVRLPTSDGVILAGWYVPPRDTPGEVIVLLHGARGDRCGTVWHASQLIEAGYGVFLYDQRALGESSGQKVSMGWLDGPDLLAVIADLENRPDVDENRIGAVGLSGGGHIALNAIYMEPGCLEALWLDGVQAQRIEDFPAPENIGEKFATLLNVVILEMAEFQLGRQAPPPFSEILADLEHIPIFIVAGGLDDFERRVSQKYATVIAADTQIWLLENAGHVGGPHVQPAEYRRRMLAFFQAALNE